MVHSGGSSSGCSDGGDEVSGGRSSGTRGFGVAVRGRGSWLVCWAPGGFMSTVKHSVVGMRGYGHGCAMAGGEKLSAAV